MGKPEREFFDPETLPWTHVEPGISERRLAEDVGTGLLTRLVRWDPGLSTVSTGPVVHEYVEEVMILAGSMTDLSLNELFGPGYYACRPPGMTHGPWETAEGCVMLETRYAP